MVRPSQDGVPSAADTRRDVPQAVSNDRAAKRRMMRFMPDAKTKNVQNRDVLHMILRRTGLHLGRRGEFAEEAHVVLEVVTEVVDLPLEHRDAFHAHAE